MIIILFQILFILGVLGVLFIIGRKLPALSQLSEKPSVERFSFKAIIQWPGNVAKQLFLSDFFQNVFIGNLEKSLRKFKIAALKIDNIIDKFIRKLKKNSGNGTPS